MALTLHNYTLSGSCYKVRLLLEFLQIDYHTISVDFFPGKEHKTPEFLALNPLGQIPVLEDGALQLRDAQAILCYLARKYDPSAQYLPDDPAVFGQVMMWLAFAGNELMAASAARLHDVLGYSLNVASARAEAQSAFAILDDHLAERQSSEKHGSLEMHQRSQISPVFPILRSRVMAVSGMSPTHICAIGCGPFANCQGFMPCLAFQSLHDAFAA